MTWAEAFYHVSTTAFIAVGFVGVVWAFMWGMTRHDPSAEAWDFRYARYETVEGTGMLRVGKARAGASSTASSTMDSRHDIP